MISGLSYGFLIKSFAPNKKHCFSLSLSEVITMKGIFLITGSFCLFFNTSMPSIIGIITSRTTKSITSCSLAMISRHSFPLKARLISNSSSRKEDKMSPLISSSSTMRIVLFPSNSFSFNVNITFPRYLPFKKVFTNLGFIINLFFVAAIDINNRSNLFL